MISMGTITKGPWEGTDVPEVSTVTRSTPRWLRAVVAGVAAAFGAYVIVATLAAQWPHHEPEYRPAVTTLEAGVHTGVGAGVWTTEVREGQTCGYRRGAAPATDAEYGDYTPGTGAGSFSENTRSNPGPITVETVDGTAYLELTGPCAWKWSPAR